MLAPEMHIEPVTQQRPEKGGKDSYTIEMATGFLESSEGGAIMKSVLPYPLNKKINPLQLLLGLNGHSAYNAGQLLIKLVHEIKASVNP